MKLMPMILWMVVDINDKSANHGYNPRSCVRLHLSTIFCDTLIFTELRKYICIIKICKHLHVLCNVATGT